MEYEYYKMFLRNMKNKMCHFECHGLTYKFTLAIFGNGYFGKKKKSKAITPNFKRQSPGYFGRHLEFLIMDRQFGPSRFFDFFDPELSVSFVESPIYNTYFTFLAYFNFF
jgi:hypothetical protein